MDVLWQLARVDNNGLPCVNHGDNPAVRTGVARDHVVQRLIGGLRYAHRRSALLALSPVTMTIREWCECPDHLKHSDTYIVRGVLSATETDGLFYTFSRWCALQLINPSPSFSSVLMRKPRKGQKVYYESVSNASISRLCPDMPDVVRRYLETASPALMLEAARYARISIYKAKSITGRIDDWLAATAILKIIVGTDAAAVARMVVKRTVRTSQWLGGIDALNRQLERMAREWMGIA